MTSTRSLVNAVPGSGRVRDQIASAVRGLLSGGPNSVPSSRGIGLRGASSSHETNPYRPGSDITEPAGDPGLFGPDSIAWRVGQDPAALLGGVRALLLQTVHPLAMAGVAEHSDYRHDPWGRLQRTAQYVAITTFGSTDAAHRTIDMVKAVHSRVEGVAPDGRHYSAQDPALLTWVHTTEIDSFLTAVREYGSIELTDAEADQYVAEMAVLGRLMGGTDVPESVDEISEYYKMMRPALLGSPQARGAARFLMWPPVPLPIRPAYGVVAAAAVATLPNFVRKELWLPQTAKLDNLVTKPAGKLVADILGWSLGDSLMAAAALARASAEAPTR
ncbi:MAG: DUF2236 domain-containing protein [Actinobacteria bacterium]|nr:DUF2236 domain-containing protein [Actinomycetota bacterium]